MPKRLLKRSKLDFTLRSFQATLSVIQKTNFFNIWHKESRWIACKHFVICVYGRKQTKKRNKPDIRKDIFKVVNFLIVNNIVCEKDLIKASYDVKSQEKGVGKQVSSNYLQNY